MQFGFILKYNEGKYLVRDRIWWLILLWTSNLSAKDNVNLWWTSIEQQNSIKLPLAGTQGWWLNGGSTVAFLSTTVAVGPGKSVIFGKESALREPEKKTEELQGPI